MKTPLLHLLATLALTSALTCGRTIPNNAAADLVLGQATFTTGSPLTVSANSLRGPTAITMDPVSGKLFVADSVSGRVLRYANAAALQNGAPAEAVLGQPNLATDAVNPVIGLGMNYPSALFFDRFKRLWVADQNRNRVLMYSAADFRESGTHPDKVFGQPDFTTTSSTPVSANKMRSPCGLWVDKDDRLWVADQNNNRILRFDSVTTKPAVNAAADGVLGQPDFTTATVGSAADKLITPEGVTVSASGQVFVADYGNHRILRFDNAAATSGLVSASAVLGQPDFTIHTQGITATQLDSPAGVFLTPDDQLWVTDYGNNRMVRFNNASTKANGAAADGVLGQPDFTTRTTGTTAQSLRFPYYSPFADSAGKLWVPDTGNNRVLRFSPDATPPLLAVTAPAKVTKKPKITVKGTASDTYGISKVEYRIGKGPFKLATGTTVWSFRVNLKKGKNTITVIATDVDGIRSLRKVIKITRK